MLKCQGRFIWSISKETEIKNNTDGERYISTKYKSFHIQHHISMDGKWLMTIPGSWLSVVPSPSLGLHLRAAEFIPKYRLGIPIYSTDGSCPAYFQPSDRMGDHTLWDVPKLVTGLQGITCYEMCCSRLQQQCGSKNSKSCQKHLQLFLQLPNYV